MGYVSVQPSPELALLTERYDRIRQKLIRFFACQHCSDPKDLADETILRALVALTAGKEITCQLETYLFGIAKNVVHEDRKSRQRMAVSPDGGLKLPVETDAGLKPDPLDDDLELPVWQQERYHTCLERCLQKLPSERRAALVQFHEGNEEGEQIKHRKKLAEQFNINPRALNGRMVRLRNRLEECIKACLKNLPPE